jgi:hypothetical protein
MDVLSGGPRRYLHYAMKVADALAKHYSPILQAASKRESFMKCQAKSFSPMLKL